MIIRSAIITAGCLILLATAACATDDPHDSTNVIYCEHCHIAHNTLGDILINATDSLVTTLCLSCHTPGGWVNMTRTLAAADRADPGVSGTSHAWDAPAENAQRGAQLPQTQSVLDHLSQDNRITCATCHDPHNNTVSPFLRLDNSANALCFDCHRSREIDSVRTYTGTTLSHPVGVTVPSTESYHSQILDVDGNPQPSDGNTTNDLTLMTGNQVGCTTCHGVHYTDSNSGTVDGP